VRPSSLRPHRRDGAPGRHRGGREHAPARTPEIDLAAPALGIGHLYLHQIRSAKPDDDGEALAGECTQQVIRDRGRAPALGAEQIDVFRGAVSHAVQFNGMAAAQDKSAPSDDLQANARQLLLERIH